MELRMVDLTQEIFQGMSVFPMHQQTLIFPNATHEESLKKCGFMFATNNLLINEHGPTHTDALYESDPHGTTIEKTPLDYFIGQAVCLDVSHVKETEFISDRVLEEAEKRGGQYVKKDDIVLLYTGHYDRNYGTDKWQTSYTGLDISGAEWLGRKGVKNIGVDTPSIDRPDDRKYSGHLICQKYRMLNTENLCNLKEVAGKRFVYVGLPLKIRGGSGAPIRAIAICME